MDELKPDQSNDQPRALVLLRQILAVHESDVDCECCGDQLECIAEMAAAGQDIRVILPAVQAHLECCADCREEFEALLCILRAEQSGQVQ
jgi:hypothetical protein